MTRTLTDFAGFRRVSPAAASMLKQAANRVDAMSAKHPFLKATVAVR